MGIARAASAAEALEEDLSPVDAPPNAEQLTILDEASTNGFDVTGVASATTGDFVDIFVTQQKGICQIMNTEAKITQMGLYIVMTKFT